MQHIQDANCVEVVIIVTEPIDIHVDMVNMLHFQVLLPVQHVKRGNIVEVTRVHLVHPVHRVHILLQDLLLVLLVQLENIGYLIPVMIVKRVHILVHLHLLSVQTAKLENILLLLDLHRVHSVL